MLVVYQYNILKISNYRRCIIHGWIHRRLNFHLSSKLHKWAENCVKYKVDQKFERDFKTLHYIAYLCLI